MSCDGAIIKTCGYDVGEDGIPPGVIGRHAPKKGPVQYCAHMTTVKYHFIAFDREALRVKLSKHLTSTRYLTSLDIPLRLSRAREDWPNCEFNIPLH